MASVPLIRTRFAPSPSGRLHLGHALAALTAARLAGPGGFILRIEDIDRAHCPPEYEAAIYDDLRWLGLDWQQPVMRQSERFPAYTAALEQLSALDLIYPCRCSRGDIRSALSAPQEGVPVAGPDGLVYPGTCRARLLTDAGDGDALRLDSARALTITGSLSYIEKYRDPCRKHMDESLFIESIGDPVLWRRGAAPAYHLAVVVDDAAQDITLVSRGADLAEATWIHVLLQRLLGLPTPAYWHHDLIRDTAGKRLAKRDDARSLDALRTEGWTPQDVIHAVRLSGAMISTGSPPRTAV